VVPTCIGAGFHTQLVIGYDDGICMTARSKQLGMLIHER